MGIGLGGLALAISIALPIILPVIHFPHPTGPYAIGTLTLHQGRAVHLETAIPVNPTIG